MKLSQISTAVSMAMINVLYIYANCNMSAYAVFPTNIKAHGTDHQMQQYSGNIHIYVQ